MTSLFFKGIVRRAAALMLVLCLSAVMFSCSKKEPKPTETDPTTPSSTPAPETPEPTPEPVYESVMIGTVVNVSTFLNVRSGPGTTSEVVGKAYSGDKFTVVLKYVDGGHWHKIEYGSGFAYVHSDYLEITTELVEVTD